MAPILTWYGVPQCAAVTTQLAATREPPQLCRPAELCSDAMNEWVSDAGTPPTIFVVGRSAGGGVGAAWAGSVPAGARRAAGSTARSLRFLIGGGSFHTSGGRADRRALTVTRPAARELCGVGPVHRLSTTIRGPPMPRPRRPGPGGRPFYWDGRPPPANFLLRPAAD